MCGAQNGEIFFLRGKTSLILLFFREPKYNESASSFYCLPDKKDPVCVRERETEEGGVAVATEA